MSLPALPFLHAQQDGTVLIHVHVMPNAAQTQIQGLHDGALRVRLHAPPVDGKANLALTTWLAKTLGVPKSAVELRHGVSSRRKQLRITAIHAAQADWLRLQPPD